MRLRQHLGHLLLIAGALVEVAGGQSAPSTGAAVQRRIRVCTLGDGAPVPGATIEAVFEPPWTGRSAKRSPWRIDTFAIRPRGVEAATARLTTNAQGEVALPAFEGSALLRASHRGLMGRCWISSSDERRWIADSGQQVIDLSAPIDVLVLDHRGAPAVGVPVTIGARPPLQYTKEVCLTDSDGHARFDNFEPGASGYHDGTRTFVALAVPSLSLIGSETDVNRPHPEPIRLTLPPTGLLRVRLLGLDGSPFIEPAFASVVARVVAPATGETNPIDSRPGCDAWAFDGIVTFTHVTVGSPLLVRVSPIDETRCTVLAEVEGPKDLGAVQTVDVRCGTPSIHVSAGFVSPEGAPLREIRECSISLGSRPVQGNDAPVTGQSFELRPDRANGRIEGFIDLDATSLEANVARLDVRFEDSGRGSHTQTVLVDLPHGVRSGAVDLGNVVIGQSQRLATGRAIDQAGNPVPNARVIVVQKLDDDWTEIHRHDHPSTITRADGGFELLGRRDGRQLGLVASSKSSFQLEPVPFQCGASNVEVVLVPAGRIEGSFVGDPGAEEWPWAGMIDVRVTGQPRSIDGEISQGWPVMNHVDWNGGRFTIGPVAPGTCSLEVSVVGSNEPAVRIDGVAIQAGAACRDPRLIGLDASRLAPQRRVRVLDPSGAPIRSATVRAETPRGRWGPTPRRRVDENGATRFACPASAEVVVNAPGYGSRVLRDVRDDFELRLGDADRRSVALTLDASTSPLPPLLEVCARLSFSQPPPDSDREDWPSRSEIPDSKTVALGAQRRVEVPSPLRATTT